MSKDMANEDVEFEKDDKDQNHLRKQDEEMRRLQERANKTQAKIKERTEELEYKKDKERKRDVDNDKHIQKINKYTNGDAGLKRKSLWPYGTEITRKDDGSILLSKNKGKTKKLMVPRKDGEGYYLAETTKKRSDSTSITKYSEDGKLLSYNHQSENGYFHENWRRLPNGQLIRDYARQGSREKRIFEKDGKLKLSHERNGRPYKEFELNDDLSLKPTLRRSTFSRTRRVQYHDNGYELQKGKGKKTFRKDADYRKEPSPASKETAQDAERREVDAAYARVSKLTNPGSRHFGPYKHERIPDAMGRTDSTATTYLKGFETGEKYNQYPPSEPGAENQPWVANRLVSRKRFGIATEVKTIPLNGVEKEREDRHQRKRDLAYREAEHRARKFGLLPSGINQIRSGMSTDEADKILFKADPNDLFWSAKASKASTLVNGSEPSSPKPELGFSKVQNIASYEPDDLDADEDLKKDMGVSEASSKPQLGFSKVQTIASYEPDDLDADEDLKKDMGVSATSGKPPRRGPELPPLDTNVGRVPASPVSSVSSGSMHSAVSRQSSTFSTGAVSPASTHTSYSPTPSVSVPGRLSSQFSIPRKPVPSRANPNSVDQGTQTDKKIQIEKFLDDHKSEKSKANYVSTGTQTPPDGPKPVYKPKETRPQVKLDERHNSRSYVR